MESTTLTPKAGLARGCAIFKVDLKGRLVFLDDEAESLFGYSEAELYGRPLVNYLVPDDRQRLTGWLQRKRFEHPDWENCAVSIVNRQGEQIILDTIVSVHFSGGVPANYQFVVRGVTIPKTEEETKSAVFLDFTSDLKGLYTAAGEGQALAQKFVATVVERFSWAWAGFFVAAEKEPLLVVQAGSPPAGFNQIGGKLKTLKGQKRVGAVAVNGSDPAEFVAVAVEIGLKERGYLVAGPAQAANLRPVPREFLEHFSAVFGTLYASALQHERLEETGKTLAGAEQERQHLQRLLEQKTKQMAEAADSLAHDLRAPLVAVQGFAKRLANECGSAIGPQGQFSLLCLQENVEIMGKMIDDLLQFSRVTHTPEKPQPLPLREVVTDLLEEFRSTSSQPVEWRGVEELPTVVFDKGKLTQVLRNLLGNAITYTEGKGHPKVTLGWTDRPEAWEIRISDNGIGIPRQYHKKIFEMFTRVPNAVTKKQPGTGMGLAIVKKVLEDHGGKIWVDSHEGRGSTFHLVIPKPAAEGKLPPAEERQP